MKKITIFIFIFSGFMMSFAQQEPIAQLTEDQIENNTTSLINRIRINIDNSDYSSVYNDVISEINNKKVTATWLLYVLATEAAYHTGKLGNMISFIPNKGNLRVFRQAVISWNAGNELTAAKILGTIASVDPSIDYLCGKLYFALGKQYEGAGYTRIGGDITVVPYGLYYAGLGQNSVGNYSKAYSFLNSARKLLLQEEKNIKSDIQIQMAIAEFGNNNYDSAYELIIPEYNERPVDVLIALDPGIILTAMKKNEEAKQFWNNALKKKLPNNLVTQIRAELNLNKRLMDPNYPPAWMNR